jgi:serine/threonine protein kinase
MKTPEPTTRNAEAAVLGHVENVPPPSNQEAEGVGYVTNGPAASPDLDDPRVIAAVQEYLAGLECEQKLSRSEFLQRHAEIADTLAVCLAGLEFVHQAASGLHTSALHPPVATASADANALIGTPLGDFQILREIGRGGMGIVYEAEQLSLGRRVALKILPFAAALDSKQLQRFKKEAQAAAHLHHTNIVPIHAVGCERGVHYYAMQYIEGRTVAALIRDLRQLAGLETPDPSGSAASPSALASELLSGRWAPARPKGRGVLKLCGGEEPTDPYRPTTPPTHRPTTLPPHDPTPAVAARSTENSASSRAFFRTVAHLGVQAAEALEHAHAKGIIHRDIKPANLLVDANGNLWITDFGLARMLGEAGLTMTGDLVGTLRYMSPEQGLAKRVPIDQRTDIYSLGVTIYELLTLRPAYDGRDRQELLHQIAFEEPRRSRRWNKAIPTELDTIVGKAIAKNPAERYATAQELADDLRRFLDDMPIHAKRPTLLDWTRKWARRHQGVVATGVAGLILAVGTLALSTLVIMSWYRTAVTNLYRSYVREAKTIRQARAQSSPPRSGCLPGRLCWPQTRYLERFFGGYQCD